MSVTPADLETARTRLEEAQEAIEQYGEDQVEAVAEAHEAATDLLDRYADSATGTGDFAAYVEFQENFLELVDSLPEDLPEREAFEAANETLDRRRLREKDFEHARETLDPAREVAALLEERDAARGALSETRRDVRRRLSDIDSRLDDLRRLRTLGEADLSAPTEQLRKPIEAYDDAVTDAFERFRREAPAREVLEFVSTAAAYPLVNFRVPPESLYSYLVSTAAGTAPIPTLADYAGYSRSKLDHYVDDTDRFRQAVATNETYLSRLDADPLLVGWPPPERGRLRHRAEELVSVVGRFADDSVVATAREVRNLALGEEYDRLRQSAVARAELTDDERERLADGLIDDELAALREERERLQAALDAESSATDVPHAG